VPLSFELPQPNAPRAAATVIDEKREGRVGVMVSPGANIVVMFLENDPLESFEAFDCSMNLK
jgi:hypothetical protein